MQMQKLTNKQTQKNTAQRVIFVGENFHQKLETSVEIIFVVLNFVVIRSQIRELWLSTRATTILHDRDGALQH